MTQRTYRLIAARVLVLGAAVVAGSPMGLIAQDEPLRGRLTGTVRDAETGEGIANAVVSVPARSLAVLASSDGAFGIEGVPFGTHVIRVARIGYGERTFVVTFSPGGSALELAMPPVPITILGIDVGVEGDVGISGDVVDGGTGEPMADVFVWLATEERGTTTDSLGAFRFTRVDAGPGLVQVEHTGYGRQYLPIVVSPESPPVRVVMTPDSVALRGIPAISDQLRARRNRSPGIVRTFERDRLNTVDAEDLLQVVQNFTFANVVACQGSVGAQWCVDVNGTPREAGVCIDGVPALAGLDELQRYRPHELYLLEVSPSGLGVRAYTHAYMERLAHARTGIVAAEPTPQRAGVEGLGWESARGASGETPWQGPRC